MSLPATHLQFALDWARVHRRTPTSTLLFGTLYPDSRYVTRVPREQTHPTSRAGLPTQLDDDFAAGWSLHLYYDLAFATAIAPWMPRGLAPASFPNTAWRWLTAAKLVEELATLRRLNPTVRRLLSQTERFPRNPNSEGHADLDEYLQRVRDLLAADSPKEEYLSWLLELGVPADGVEEIRSLVATISDGELGPVLAALETNVAAQLPHEDATNHAA